MAADRWRTSGSADGESRPELDGGAGRGGAVDRPRGPEPQIGESRPERPLPRVDRPRLGADGSWEWKGHRLEPGDNEIADRGLDRRREVEPAVTRDMRSIVAGLPHARLEGCPDHTLKGPDRFKEKLARNLARWPDVPATELDRDIPDGIRYTFSVDDARYTAGVAEVHERLTALGYELQRQTNSWDDPGYKGVNSRWIEARSGEMIEVQFHTPTSWEVNKTTHDAYEELAKPGTDPARRRELLAWREHQTASIPVPPGARELPDYGRELP